MIHRFHYCAGGWVGGGDNQGREVADHVDTGHVYWSPRNEAASLSSCLSVVSLGLHLALNISELLWDSEWVGGRWTRRIDETGFFRMKQLLTDNGCWPRVASFDHIDEPFHRTGPLGTNRPKADVANDLRYANSLLAAVCPTIPRTVAFAWTELLPGHASEMPAALDAFGFNVVAFDLYSDTTVLNNHLNDPTLFAACLTELKRRCPNFPIIVIPDAFMTATDTPELKLARINLLYNYALSDPQVIAFTPYTWNDIGTGVTSVRNLPWMLNRYRDIGLAYRSKP